LRWNYPNWAVRMEAASRLGITPGAVVAKVFGGLASPPKVYVKLVWSPEVRPTLVIPPDDELASPENNWS
jgi:hypothetical protein